VEKPVENNDRDPASTKAEGVKPTPPKTSADKAPAAPVASMAAPKAVVPKVQETPAKVIEAPAKAEVPAKAAAPVPVKAPVNVPTKVATPAKVVAPAKAVAPTKGEASVKTVAPAKVVAPAKAVAPAKFVAPVKAAAPIKAPVAPKMVAPAKAVAAVKKTVAAEAVAAQKVIKAVASPAKKVEPKLAKPATLAATVEGKNFMATVKTTEATDKAAAMLGEMNTRFKSAFEKSSKMGEEMVEFSKGNVEAMVASARIAAKAGESIGKEAAEYSKKSLENTVALFKSFASVKSPTELFQLQSDFAKSSFDSAVAEASKMSESLMKVVGEVTQPLSTRYALAAEKIKTASL
jgi:phasin family protein